jgi:hypothetical protein
MNICHWHVKGLILQQETGGASRSATSGVVSDAKPIATATDLRRVFTIDEFAMPII